MRGRVRLASELLYQVRQAFGQNCFYVFIVLQQILVEFREQNLIVKHETFCPGHEKTEESKTLKCNQSRYSVDTRFAVSCRLPAAPAEIFKFSLF